MGQLMGTLGPSPMEDGVVPSAVVNGSVLSGEPLALILLMCSMILLRLGLFRFLFFSPSCPHFSYLQEG